MITEMDIMDQLEENHWHRVYVGLTRAQAHVGMVMSARAESAMFGRLNL